MGTADPRAMRCRRIALVLACGAALLAPAARATLGEPAASVALDRARLGGELQQRARALVVGAAVQVRVQVQTLVLADGSAVRQYSLPAGPVFAVVWTMHYKPRLDQLLGASFAPYVDAARSAARRRPGLIHNAVVQTGDLVVESSSHLNVYVGRAYLRSMLPTAMSPDAIQ